MTEVAPPYRRPGETDHVKCHSCAQPNEPDARICPKCGASLVAPRRGTALVLTLLAPFWGLGVGHVYAGRFWRGLVWAVATTGWFVPFALLARPIGGAVGYRVFIVLAVAGAFVVWAAAIVDLRRLPLSGAHRVDTWRVVLAAFGFFVLERASALALRAWVLEAFKTPSGSMIPSILVGDHLFVAKSSRPGSLDRGTVIVHAFPEHHEQDFIKRVIALPGDELLVKNGHPWINGWEVPSCKVGRYSYAEPDSVVPRHDGDLFVEFLGAHAYLTFYDSASGAFPELQGPWTAKAGEVWVMGDNRNNSHDSRMWWGGQGGGVPFEMIRGPALFLWLSVNDRGVDGSRFGQDIDRAVLPGDASALQPHLDACLKARPPADKALPPAAAAAAARPRD
jgi:signal peptidase I